MSQNPQEKRATKKPALFARLFSKPAREASRALNQFGRER